MAKKKPTALSSATSSNIYVGNSSSANNVIITSSSTNMAIPITYPSYPSFSISPNVTDGFYEDDGRLFWKNSKGEVFQVTFTKQETVKQILEDL